MLEIQVLDLSFNRLTGSIPASFGKLTSLLWLMLDSNSLSGEIPQEIGNCTSLLWFNVANNKLSGGFHPKLTNMGSNPFPTFEVNRQRNDSIIIAATGECLELTRWILVKFPPFLFIYEILMKKNYRSLWRHILEGEGLFPGCTAGLMAHTLEIPAYLQLSGNKISGEIPASISQMKRLSMLHLGFNEFEGRLPPEIGKLPLSFLTLPIIIFQASFPKKSEILSACGILICLGTISQEPFPRA